MSAIEFDFSDVQKSKFRNIPDGDYSAQITSVEEKKFNSGNSGLVVNIETVGNVDEAYNGVSFRRNIVFTSAAKWVMAELLSALGEESHGKKVTADPETFPGRYIGISVEREEYTNKDGQSALRSAVKNFFAVPDQTESATNFDDSVEAFNLDDV